MFKTIADPADCEVRSVILFLNAKKVKPAETHRQLVEIYGENIMTDGMVGKWVRQFNDGRANVHDEARSGRPLLSMMSTGGCGYDVTIRNCFLHGVVMRTKQEDNPDVIEKPADLYAEA
ncbi:hypothetical protein AVEN_49684-1 [Araneus ventricosus]|uniref:Mos1 transposase HTH domain-containing protein n=1 Tax=Araneus ventricosus TaxID=182803 RepID=A0A4Y2SRT0_ARAVE|nr:hypothetical protein AVEN_49684-1 [Araneus ventricosus]